MRLDPVRLSKLDVDSAAIGQSSGFARREVFVCIRHTLVELFLKLVLFRVRIGVATAPNFLDELLPLLVCFEFLPGVALRLSQDQIDVIDPLDVRLLELLLDFARFFFGIAFWALCAER